MPKGALPGDGKRPGRPKGSKNKRTILAASVRDRLEQMGCDPIEIMARIAIDPHMPAELRAKTASDLARYLYPQRKAVEITGAAGGPVRIESTARGRLVSLLARASERIGAGVPPQQADGV